MSKEDRRKLPEQIQTTLQQLFQSFFQFDTTIRQKSCDIYWKFFQAKYDLNSKCKKRILNVDKWGVLLSRVGQSKD